MKRAVTFFTIILAMTMTMTGCGSSTSSASTSSTSSYSSSASVDSASGSSAAQDSASGSSAAQDSVSDSSVEQDSVSDSLVEQDSSESSSASTGAGETTGLVTPVESLDLTDMFSKRDQDASYDESSAAKIVLNGTSAEVSGSGVSADGSVITISEEGTYIVSGTLTDGQIIVDADEADKVQIVLDGVEMTNDDSACILVLSADKVVLTLADGTVSTLSDTGDEFAQESEDYTVDGVIFSREDLTLNGSGTLVVNANYKHGIVSKDDLVITEGTYEITAKGKGITGKDSVRIKDGTVTVSSDDDAIHTSNGEDAGKGFVYIEGGTLSLASGDDGIHAETALVVAGGSIDVTQSYEGFEGATIDIKDGTINIKASDDGMNAAISDGDSDSADGIENDGFMFRDDETDLSDIQTGSAAGMKQGGPRKGMGSGENNGMPGGPRENMGNDENAGNIGSGGMRGGKGGMMDAQPDAYLRISGGTIYVDADGDGLDSNGMLYVEGGTVTVSGPTNSGNGALDYGTGAEISGGTLIAAGSSGMAETFGDSSTQYSILYNFDTAIAGGTEFRLLDADGNTVLSAVPEKDYQSLVLSSADLSDGTYTIQAGSEEAKIEVSSTVTTAGAEGGMMGMRGFR